MLLSCIARVLLCDVAGWACYSTALVLLDKVRRVMLLHVLWPDISPRSVPDGALRPMHREAKIGTSSLVLLGQVCSAMPLYVPWTKQHVTGEASKPLWKRVARTNCVKHGVRQHCRRATRAAPAVYLQDFKTAHLLGVAPSAQLVAMLLGSAASVPLSVAAYMLYTSAWQVSERLESKMFV